MIHYCCDNTRNMRAPNTERRSEAPHMYWPQEKWKIRVETPFSQLNLSSVDHVWVEYNVAESRPSPVQPCIWQKRFGKTAFYDIIYNFSGAVHSAWPTF
jgi:hypothetical protein